MDASWSCPGGTDHYLDVLARKPGAVACARALKPNILSLLWQEYLAALKSTQPQPEQEFVHTLLLLRDKPHVEDAVQQALEMGAAATTPAQPIHS